MEQKTITHILVDMDGTLVNTDFSNYMAYKEAFENVTGREMIAFNPQERFNRLVLMRCYPEYSAEIVTKIREQKALLYSKYLKYTYKNECVVEKIKLLAKSKKIVLVTKCSERRVSEVLSYHKIFNIFADKLYYVKASNKYACAICKLNIAPTSVIVYEDTPVEIADAVSAGVPENQIINVKINHIN